VIKQLNTILIFVLLCFFVGTVSSQEQSTTSDTPSDSTEVLDSQTQVETTEQGGTNFSSEEINPIDLSYRVSEGSEQLLLDVEEAFMTWQEASVGAIESRQEQDATIVFDGGDAALMGPDIFTLKLDRRTQVDGVTRPESKILVAESFRETSSNIYKSALLNEVGLLVGLPLTGEGVMQRGLTQEISPEVSISEARALEAQATTAEEDLNRNGKVDFYDLIELAKNYTEFPQNFGADISGDGVVNDDDVTALKEVYEFSDPTDPDTEGDSETTSTDSLDSSTDPEQDSNIEDSEEVLDAAAKSAEAARAIKNSIEETMQENESNSTGENSTQESSEVEVTDPPENSSEGQ